MLSILDAIVPLGGFIGGIVTASLRRGHEFKLAALKARKEDLKAARANNNEFVAWTRRTVTLALTAFVVLGPILAMFYGYPTIVSYTETNGWLPTWLFGETDVIWKTLPHGLVITPLHQYAFEAVVGFYFGSK